MIRFSISPSDLLRLSAFSDGKCMRHDIVVRYIAAREYLRYGRLSYLYEKQQRARIAKFSSDPTEKFTPERFTELIGSMKTRGYDMERPIVVGVNRRIMQGSHRLAAALALDVPSVSAIQLPKEEGDEDAEIYAITFTGEEKASIETMARKLCPPCLLYDPKTAVWESFKKRMTEVEYPPNHLFDPETLAPSGQGNGSLAERVKCLRVTAKELFDGGDSLLDVGSNKGFFCLALAPAYKKLTGCEPDENLCSLAEDLRMTHDLANVRFVNQSFESFPTGEQYATTYCGHVHHHLLNAEIVQKREPLEFMRKLAALTGHILVLDGPFALTDVTLKDIATKSAWPAKLCAEHTLDLYAAKISDQFTLLRQGPSGTSTRTIAVFQRRP